MKFGLSDSQYEFILSEAVLPIEALGATIWCYGSRARGDHKPFSDLDLMVESDSDLSKIISETLEMISNSNFPYKVDLVAYSQFAENYKSGYQQDKKRFI